VHRRFCLVFDRDVLATDNRPRRQLAFDAVLRAARSDVVFASGKLGRKQSDDRGFLNGPDRLLWRHDRAAIRICLPLSPFMTSEVPAALLLDRSASGKPAAQKPLGDRSDLFPNDIPLSVSVGRAVKRPHAGLIRRGRSESVS
jgi:hypothetical protein